MYVIAVIHKTYYEYIESYLKSLAKEMNEVIFNNSELIISSGTFEGHVVYKIEGEDLIQHAEKHYALNTSNMLQIT